MIANVDCFVGVKDDIWEWSVWIRWREPFEDLKCLGVGDVGFYGVSEDVYASGVVCVGVAVYEMRGCLGCDTFNGNAKLVAYGWRSVDYAYAFGAHQKHRCV